jgi:hypothetical protein
MLLGAVVLALTGATTGADAKTTAPTAPTTTAPTTTQQLAPTAPWEPLPTAAAQVGAGAAAACFTGVCVGVPLGFVPFGSVIANGVAGLMIGGTEVVVGDAVGPWRAALLWPMVTSSAILVAGSVASLSIAVANRAPLSIDPNNPGVYLTAPEARLPLAIQGASVVAAVIAPAVVYAVVAVPKAAGDGGGFGMPGLVVPADPTGAAAPELAPASPLPEPELAPLLPPPTAMRF